MKRPSHRKHNPEWPRRGKGARCPQPPAYAVPWVLWQAEYLDVDELRRRYPEYKGPTRCVAADHATGVVTFEPDTATASPPEDE